MALLLLSLASLCLARPAGLEQYSLVRVIDGDTIVVTKPGADPEIHVRLLGIDCPESRRIERLEDQASTLGLTSEDALAFGKEASTFVEKTLGRDPLYLELEEGINDKYGRTIAYVWTDDEESLNLQLLLTGQAMVYDSGKTFKSVEKFQAAESIARSQRVGIWGSRPRTEPPVASLSPQPDAPVASRSPTSEPQVRSRPSRRRSEPSPSSFPLRIILLTAGIAVIIVGLRMR